jgi:hypothetical protein
MIVGDLAMGDHRQAGRQAHFDCARGDEAVPTWPFLGPVHLHGSVYNFYQPEVGVKCIQCITSTAACLRPDDGFAH